METKETNLQRAPIDSETLELFTLAFKLYEIAKMDRNVYRKNRGLDIAKNLILQYYELVNPNYNDMIYSFRRKYITNESMIEKNDTKEERTGLRLVYDYIEKFDINNDDFNIFITSVKIHSLLYSALDDKILQDEEDMTKKALALKEEAIKNRDLKSLRISREMLTHYARSTFGGKFRNSDVFMQDYQVEVPPAKDAIDKFNTFLSSEKKEEYDRYLHDEDLFSYIDYCVNTTADLIGLQPFNDGNKRTFRSLLNLMFKKRNLPPVYISTKERVPYHNALEEALGSHDYSHLDSFYYYKICDSIYELDFIPYLHKTKQCNQKEKDISF